MNDAEPMEIIAPFIKASGVDIAVAMDSVSDHLPAFREAARRLKDAEKALEAAKLAYVEAIKKLSDEACK